MRTPKQESTRRAHFAGVDECNARESATIIPPMDREGSPFFGRDPGLDNARLFVEGCHVLWNWHAVTRNPSREASAVHVGWVVVGTRRMCGSLIVARGDLAGFSDWVATWGEVMSCIWCQCLIYNPRVLDAQAVQETFGLGRS